ncbi:MAG: replication-associated recombination protein A [bacterium]
MLVPLAEQLRPNSLEEYLGQEHLIGKDAILYNAIRSDAVPSMILWGPPGSGKTTLAYIISKQLRRTFYTLSAVSSGVKEVREVISKAAESKESPFLFIDEIHRFSKSQQDALLGAVEKGVVTFIGATTENPSFEVISPLLSRCQIYILKALEERHLLRLLVQAKDFMADTLKTTIDIRENEALLRISGGDARKLLNALELIVTTEHKQTGPVEITNEKTIKIIQQNLAIYDKTGEMHYDIISAFIKSLRGSDPNAAVYWLATMIRAGEDPKFIARRMLILASEDIGNANPNALLIATTCFQAVNVIGYPECDLILSQTAIYLACSVKSNASYLAIRKAARTIESLGDQPVPLHLRNAPTSLMKKIGYGKDYKYAHDFDNNFVEQDFLPDKIKGSKFYDPQDNARENELRARLRALWKDKYKY